MNPLNISFVAVKEGISKNGIRYVGEELSKTAHELSDKPILKDHDAKVDNIVGRTGKTLFQENAVIGDGLVMDEATREKIKDGRLKEVSIGAIVDQLVMDEVAGDGIMEARGIHYQELSFTPTPGVDGAVILNSESFVGEEEEYVPPEAGSLPAHGKEILSKAYKAARKSGYDQERAAKIAWAAVKNAGYSKDADGKWHKTEQLQPEDVEMDEEKTNEETEVKTMVDEKVVEKTDDRKLIESMQMEIKELKEKLSAPQPKAIVEVAEKPKKTVIEKGNKLILEDDKGVLVVEKGSHGSITRVRTVEEALKLKGD